jgi:tripeptide aminopeptidase
MISEPRLIDLFVTLCRINAPALQERAAVDWTRAYLEKMGLEVWEDDAGSKIGGDAGNLIARLPANVEGAPKIFLSAHFDTVEPTEGLIIAEQDGVFTSASDTILGADDKAGMAPAIEAIQVLLESGEPHGEIVLLFSVAEEIGLKGAEACAIKELDLDFGYVLDTGPPVGSFVNRTATHDKLEIVVRGRPAHAGKDPENGISAIQVAADAIHSMKLGRIGPETTANLGIIEGGTAVNVVCPFVKIRGEARSTSLKELDTQVGHMIQRFEEAASKWGTIVEIEHARHYERYEVPEDSPVSRVAVEASRRLGLESVFRTTLGGSDANIYNVRGVPTLVLGTGMEKIHTHDESVSRADLVKTAELCLELIRVAAGR